MDSSTLAFIVILVVGFVFLRWLISPVDPLLTNDETENIVHRLNRSPDDVLTRRIRRPVTDDMIEVVRTIAPQLTTGQIRMDLERTGSVELTIERYMETGDLPFPPGESRPQHTDDSDNHNKPPAKTSSINLIEKYGLESQVDQEEQNGGIESSWHDDKGDRSSLLSKKRAEMILGARRRLAAQLQKEKSA